MLFDGLKRVLVFVAHPDDETIGCGVLLQRLPSALVVFAVDGAPPGYGFERKFGELLNYSEQRFKEAASALSFTPNCSFQRLKSPSGAYFHDRRLFAELEQAATSLLVIAKQFSPEAIVSHAFEGGHIDHDACSFLASHAASTLSVKCFEFPLYWQNKNGQDTFQQFRNPQEGIISLRPSSAEIAIKHKMLAEYKTQGDVVAAFSPEIERFRPVPSYDYAHPAWSMKYPGPWRRRHDAKKMLQRFSEFLC
jgi:N-acetylglucosamine malate deacetylase 2